MPRSFPWSRRLGPAALVTSLPSGRPADAGTRGRRPWVGRRDATVIGTALEEPRNLPPQPAGELRHLARHHLARLAEGLVHRGQDQVLEHLRVVGSDHLAVDLDREDLLVPVGLDGHHPAARGGLDLPLRDLLLEGLELGLELLRLLDEVPEPFHVTSPLSGDALPVSAGSRGAPRAAGRMSVTSPSNSSTAACTAGWLVTGAPPSAARAAAAPVVNCTSRTSGRTRRAASSTSWRLACCRTRSCAKALPFGSETVSRPPSSDRTTASASRWPSVGRARVTSSTMRAQAASGPVDAVAVAVGAAGGAARRSGGRGGSRGGAGRAAGGDGGD